MTKTVLTGPDNIKLHLDDDNPYYVPTVHLYDDQDRLCIATYDNAIEWGTLYGDDADYEIDLTEAQSKWLEDQRPAVDEATILARV